MTTNIKMSNKLILLLLIIFIGQLQCYMIPGVSNQKYEKNELIEVYVQQLESMKSMIPYSFDEYYPFIETSEVNQSLVEALLGQKKLQLDKIIFNFQNNTSCTQFGKADKLTKKDIEKFEFLLDNSYTFDIIVDNLPVTVSEAFKAVPVGEKVLVGNEYKYQIYNHFNFTVEYNDNQIVSFNVNPQILGTFEHKGAIYSSCGMQGLKDDDFLTEIISKEQILKEDSQIFFTYDVKYVENLNQTATSRWDSFKQKEGEAVHWNNILCTFGVNISLSVLIYFILKRILNKDFSKYQQVNQNDEDDMGWKQLKSDVFRAPGNPIVLSSMIGVGVQLAVILLLTVIFICFNYLAEQYQTEMFLETFIVLYVITGLVSGYYSARYYKMMNGAYWIRSTFLTAVLLPGISTLIFFQIEFSFLLENSTNAYGFGTIFKLFFMWFGLQIPLTFVGSVIGFKRPKMEAGCTINPVPLFIPPQPKFLSRHFLCVLGGVLPFGTILMELSYVMKSIWAHSFYHLFGFILLALILLIITCAEISILLTYLQLNNGNHKWWWNAFYTSGFCGVYVFGYAFFYWLFYLQITQVTSTILYFGFMGMASFAMFLFCGSVGFISSYIFIKFIYSQIKAD